jgi:hypothetical protein
MSNGNIMSNVNMNNIDYINLYNRLIMDKIYKKMQVVNGIITRKNGDSRYAVKIDGSSQSMPNVKTVEANMKFKVGDNVLVQLPFGNIQEARIIGYSDLSIGTEFLHEFDDPGGGYCGCCFLPGTKINTTRGLVSIEYITSKDYIYGYTNSGKICINKVKKLIIHNKPEELIYKYYNIITGKSNVNVTGEHRFYIGNNEYKKIEEINIGEYLYVYDKYENNIYKDIILEKNIINLTNPKITYNLELTNNHNYFANGYLVHNVKAWYIY